MEKKILVSNLIVESSTRKWIGAFIMAGFGLAAASRWSVSGEVFFILMALRDFIAAYFLATRLPAIRTSSWWPTVLAYVSSGLPLLYFSNQLVSPWDKAIADGFAIIGYLIVTLATIELGNKIGVAPAKRGKPVRTGIYRYIGHPMYKGYAIAHLGWVVFDPLNIFIYVIALFLFWCRSQYENLILSEE